MWKMTEPDVSRLNMAYGPREGATKALVGQSLLYYIELGADPCSAEVLQSFGLHNPEFGDEFYFWFDPEARDVV